LKQRWCTTRVVDANGYRAVRRVCSILSLLSIRGYVVGVAVDGCKGLAGVVDKWLIC